MPGMEHGKMPGMSDALPKRSEAFAQMPQASGHATMPGMAGGRRTAPVVQPERVQEGPQAYVLQGGETWRAFRWWADMERPTRS